MPKLTKGFAPLLILPVVVLLLVVILFVVTRIKPKVKPTATPTPTPLESVAPGTPKPFDFSNWTTYTNIKFGFQMMYPKTFKFEDMGPKNATASSPSTLDTIAFTDTNKNQFTVNIYPVSGDPAVNTNVQNLYEFSGYCGTPLADRTIISKVFKEGDISYKQVAQSDAKGRNLTDFCFFSPSGNLIVLRNSFGSTVIAMKQIISTFLFNGQTDKNGFKLYVNTDERFAFKYPSDFTLTTTAIDFIPPANLPKLIVDLRREGFKDEKAQFSQVANFAVSKSDDVPNCLKDLPLKATINGTDYRSNTVGNGAAGHTIDGTLYRTVRNSCYEVQTSVQTETGSGEGLDALASQIAQDAKNLKTVMSQILNSFTLAN